MNGLTPGEDAPGETALARRCTGMERVVIYGANWCAYTLMACELLRARRIPFSLIDVDEMAEFRAELRRRFKHNTIPVIVVDDEALGGYRELRQLERAGGLSDLRRIAA